MLTNRRSFLAGLTAAFAAPAIVRPTSIMRINPLLVPREPWIPCDGRTLSRGRYPELFAALGNTFGGDGITTFNIPDMSGSVLLGGNELRSVHYEIAAFPEAGFPMGTILTRTHIGTAWHSTSLQLTP